MSAQMTLFPTVNATSSPGSEDGATRCASLASRTTRQSGRDRARASRSASQAAGQVLLMSATFGQNSGASSASADLQRSLESRLRAALASTGSPLYDLTWKAWAMASGPPICALRASGRRTSGSGSIGEESGWMTPRARGDAGGDRWKGGDIRNLEDQVRSAGWPTPSASAFEVKDLERLQARREECKARNGNGNGFGLTLGQAVPLLAGWATPMANDATGSTHCYGRTRPDGTRPVHLKLPGQTLTALDLPMVVTADGDVLIGFDAVKSNAARGTLYDGGHLSQEHCRWMQGYPKAWHDCAKEAFAATATASSRNSARSSRARSLARRG